ncbi:hypothetical protein BJ170DRAFT_615069 [Xylariales sp. AK1849]|nr:hypothetical protein BJ170DRAFT_615069 [Xylariales sp. AK1849]
MGPFALPVPAWRLGQQQRKRKRRYNNPLADSASPEAETAPSSAHLPLDSINPRSHSPGTLRQFAAAGLAPEEEIPAKIHPNFPHKALPTGYQSSAGRRRRGRSRMSATTSGSEADLDTDASESQQRRVDGLAGDHSARMKHINTMMAIMYRCLHEGDIARAKRAFGLLIRTKDVDIRLHGMWAIGTEILMREGEDDHTQDARVNAGADATTADGEETDIATTRPPPRWGSAANVDTVRDYLENLIHQHPYDPHLPRSTSAADFWPALFSIEVYNIDAECKRALHRLAQEVESPPDTESEPPLSQSGSEDYETQMSRREDGRKDMQWAAKDEIRHGTRAAAEQIATRMDQLMENAPYTAHLELLRLRGMLALFIGDMHLSSRLVEKSELEDRLRGLSLHEGLRKGAGKEQDREAARHREEEYEKARVYFQRILEKGGELEPWLVRFLDPDEDSNGDQETVNSSALY